MSIAAEPVQDEIQIGQLTAAELREYSALGELEAILEQMLLVVTSPEDRSLERELRKHRRDMERMFRIRVSNLVKGVSLRYFTVLDTFPAVEWEVGINKGWMVVFRKDTVVRRL